MSNLIIDPPVGPYHSPEELEEWIAELEKMRVTHADDAEALEVIAEAIGEAQGWIRMRKEAEGGADAGA